MDRLKATAHIIANSSAQEQRLVKELNSMSGVENVQSKPSGTTYEVTADAPCSPPRKCGATIFKGKSIANVDVCTGCTRG